MSEKTVWIISGETSGDIYGAMLAENLKSKDSNIVLKGMGGKKMAEAGVEILVDSTDLGVVGLFEVLKQLPMFFRLFNGLVKRVNEEKPDAVILIDYPGFNVRFAKKLYKAGIKSVYYISPQVWAWGKNRIPLLGKIITKMLVIFPFEPKIYDGTGLDVQFVGHPLLDIYREKADSYEREANTVLLLPGSRFSEINRLLKPIYQTAQILANRRPELKFIIATPNENIKKHILEMVREFELQEKQHLHLEVISGKTDELMCKASAGIAASGTVTVQSAILGLPLVVVYRLNPLTYHIAKQLIDLPFFSMVNVITGYEVFQEFLQGDVKPALLSKALEDIMPDGGKRDDVMLGIKKVLRLLGDKGSATSNAADNILELISEEIT